MPFPKVLCGFLTCFLCIDVHGILLLLIESERPNPAESSVPDLEAGDTFSIDGEEDVAAHQKFEAVKVDEIKKDESVLLEAFLGSSLATQRLDLTQNLNASEDQYGTALMAVSAFILRNNVFSFIGILVLE